MSLVGTRPPTVDEWDKYELHHRARLATKPGLTGMWQVSGRSNITDLSILMGYREYLLSDENIYLSIYSLNSYVFEYDLLDANDRELYHSLQDKFDKKVINKVILKVRKRIEELLNKDEEFIEVKVYFKPKKMSKDGLEFRPLHTTDLITQIAIVAMLHLFVYCKTNYRSKGI